MNTKGLWIAACLASGVALGAAGTATATSLHTTTAQVITIRAPRSMVTPGTRIIATINQTISTSHSHPGDRFTATTTAPVFDTRGKIAIPTGSLLSGRVHVADRGRGRFGHSQIALGVEGVLVGNAWTPIAGTVVLADRYIYMSGVRTRERQRIYEGSRIEVNMDQGVHAAVLRRGIWGYGIGGGPIDY